jgi:hypothetical protein
MEVPTIVKVLSLIIGMGSAYLFGYLHASENE